MEEHGDWITWRDGTEYVEDQQLARALCPMGAQKAEFSHLTTVCVHAQDFRGSNDVHAGSEPDLGA